MPFFPTVGIMPKEETTAASFVAKNPDFDGRGIIIGILDTGVDPGTSGLQTTSHGLPKVIDIIDCSGSGDVDTSKIVEITPSTDASTDDKPSNTQITLTGLTGRLLKLPPTVNNPSGRFHVGIKRAYELYPRALVKRLKAERKKTSLALASTQLADLQISRALFDVAHPDVSKLSKDDVKVKKNTTSLISSLNDATKEFDDPGPIFDVITFLDETNTWQSLVDTSESGDMEDVMVMTDYRVKRQFRCFDTSDMLNFSVNIFEDGNVLSINVDAGAHGSHVASITAGYHSDDLSMSGVAPGAQIISLKVGDSRLGSMETSKGVTRAIKEAVKRGCHIINMSYGEAAQVCNQGRFVQLATEIVDKYNVMFVASAGNNGPGLSTVGAPGGTSSALISVGAYVSQAMMKADYSMREPASKGSNFTWSSAGPAHDGDIGVDIIAPGGAICGVPTWTLQKNQLMNGTSMSAPNCCGCIALLLSGLFKSGWKYNVAGIKNAIYNTAMDVKLSPLIQGFGMIQVERAYEYLENQHAQEQDKNGTGEGNSGGNEGVNFKVSVNRQATPRGIYMRQMEECSKVQTFSININPEWGDSYDEETQSERINFLMKINLSTSPTSTSPTPNFLTHPSHLVLMNGGRSFEVKIDPSKLEPGLHFTRLYGYDSDNSEGNFIFSLPITICKPRTIAEDAIYPNLGTLSFEPAETKRFFLDVPSGATFMDVTVKDCRSEKNDSTTRLVVLHSLQLLPHVPYRDAEHEKYITFLPGQESMITIKLEPSITTELSLTRYWSAIGDTEVSCHVSFRGVIPTPNNICIGSGYGSGSGGGVGDGGQVRVISLMGDESIAPMAKLNVWQRNIRPKESTITPLSSRDTTNDNSTIYALILSYEIVLAEATSITVRAPLLNNTLYESHLEGQFCMLYDDSKKLLGVCDCWPEPIKCGKGTVTIRFMIRHDKVSTLETFTNMVLTIERALSPALTLDVYRSRELMIKKGAKGHKSLIRRGNSASMYFDTPEVSKLPKTAEVGDVLIGTVDFEEKTARERPGGWPIRYQIPPNLPKKKEDKAVVSEVKDVRSEMDKMNHDIRDFKITRIEKMVGKSEFDEVYPALLVEYPAHLPLLSIGMKHKDHDSKRADNLKVVIKLADEIIGLIDTAVLASWQGVKHDLTIGEEKKTSDELKMKKEMLVDALGRKCRAVIDLGEGEGEGEKKDDFEAVLVEIRKWETIEKNDHFAVLELELAKREGMYGEMLAILKRLADGAGTKGGLKEMKKADLLAVRKEVFAKLGWDNLVSYDESWRILTSLEKFSLF